MFISIRHQKPNACRSIIHSHTISQGWLHRTLYRGGSIDSRFHRHCGGSEHFKKTQSLVQIYINCLKILMSKMFLVCNYSLIQKQYQPRLGRRADEKLKPAQNRPLWNFHVVVGAWFLAPISGGFFSGLCLAGRWGANLEFRTIWPDLRNLKWHTIRVVRIFGRTCAFPYWSQFDVEQNFAVTVPNLARTAPKILRRRARRYPQKWWKKHHCPETDTVVTALWKKIWRGSILCCPEPKESTRISRSHPETNLQLGGWKPWRFADFTPCRFSIIAIMVCCSLSTCLPDYLSMHFALYSGTLHIALTSPLSMSVIWLTGIFAMKIAFKCTILRMKRAIHDLNDMISIRRYDTDMQTCACTYTWVITVKVNLWHVIRRSHTTTVVQCSRCLIGILHPNKRSR